MKSKKSLASKSHSFKETAKRYGCDESESAFEGKLRRIAAKPPKKAVKK